jgi:hypothetical protein
MSLLGNRKARAESLGALQRVVRSGDSYGAEFENEEVRLGIGEVWTGAEHFFELYE